MALYIVLCKRSVSTAPESGFQMVARVRPGYRMSISIVCHANGLEGDLHCANPLLAVLPWK